MNKKLGLILVIILMVLGITIGMWGMVGAQHSFEKIIWVSSGLALMISTLIILVKTGGLE